MIIEKTGNIFDTDCYYIVSPVSCMGVSGAGLAKQMRLRYPDYQRLYNHECIIGELIIGRPSIILPDQRTAIILFPTKEHWLQNSEIEHIHLGLLWMRKMIEYGEIDNNIAMPKIGCGLGGLDWDYVYPLIQEILGDLQVDIEVYL